MSDACVYTFSPMWLKVNASELKGIIAFPTKGGERFTAWPRK